ncbi:MAG: helix-turn-helix transcriptional regulator [Planctomycetes bacterium]|nr:helix-turn-helix transcriptional regulator [Planctomycetota bacterium]
MKRGHSQMELAFRVREQSDGDHLVTPTHVSKYERGLSVPGSSVLGSIAFVLGCSADYLLNLTDKEK